MSKNMYFMVMIAKFNELALSSRRKGDTETYAKAKYAVSAMSKRYIANVRRMKGAGIHG